jgi:hypothetical protein
MSTQLILIALGSLLTLPLALLDPLTFPLRLWMANAAFFYLDSVLP